MRRFSAFERFVHWMATVCFIILALSGLNLTFGKELLLPLVGPEAFTAVSRWGKYAHNYLSFPFTLSVILIFLMWICWNLPSRLDIQWMMEGGGFGKKHPPADLFNAGQKSIYWVVVLGGALVAATGYVLMLPFWLTGIVGMQIAQLVHALVALLRCRARARAPRLLLVASPRLPDTGVMGARLSLDQPAVSHRAPLAVSRFQPCRRAHVRRPTSAPSRRTCRAASRPARGWCARRRGLGHDLVHQFRP